MKAHLLFEKRDFAWGQSPPPGAADLIQDLDLARMFDAMAAGDPFIRQIAEKVMLASLTEPSDIAFRQAVLAECIEHADVVRDLYRYTNDTINGAKKASHFMISDSPGMILTRSIEVLDFLAQELRRLRSMAERDQGLFQSTGLASLFVTLTDQLDDEYFATIDEHLKILKFRSGLLLSANLGVGNHGHDYRLHQPPTRRSWREWLTGHPENSFTITIPDRDEAGARALGDLHARGINVVANALAQSTDHILSFFHMLLAELAFYVGCLNLHVALSAANRPLCFPIVPKPETVGVQAKNLRDVGLSLLRPGDVVGNDVQANGKNRIIITGANQGGKSTFLRSLGTSQIMFQAGMFVPAAEYRAALHLAIFTHYKREEDATMSSGKLDEELARMSGIADNLRPGCVVLFNESFAATNEREGSEIARQIVDALSQSGVDVWFVTHLFDFAGSMSKRQLEPDLFLRAERKEGGLRTFLIVPGAPLPTSYGQDLYQQIFDGSAIPPARRDPQLGSSPLRTSEPAPPPRGAHAARP